MNINNSCVFIESHKQVSKEVSTSILFKSQLVHSPEQERLKNT